MGKFSTGSGFGRKTKASQRKASYIARMTDGEKKEKNEDRVKTQKFKRDRSKDKKVKNALNKYINEVSKTVLSACIDKTPYLDRVSRIETYVYRKKKNKLFTLRDFVSDRYDIILEWCYICHRTLFSKQANILLKRNIKRDKPITQLDDMPEKIIVCHRCAHVMSNTKKIPAQSFWNKLYPGDIPNELKSLTSMEIRMIQRMIPFMKIVKYQGRFGQFGLQGQAVLFARDVCEIKDILPRKPNDMNLIMVIESLNNISRQKEMIIDQQKLKIALEWLLKHNERYKDVKIDMKALDNLEVDYSQICVVAPPVIPQNDRYNQWRLIDQDRISVLHCKRHELSETFNLHAGHKSLSMCISALVKSCFKEVSSWDSVDLDIILEEGYSLFVESMKENSKGIVTFDTIETCFTLHNKSIEIALMDKLIFKRGQIYDFVVKCLDDYGCGVLYTNQVYISIVKHNEEYYFFDSRPRGMKGYGCIKNKKNEYNGSAIVMRFSNIYQFIKRLEAQLKANRSTEYTLASIIVSESHHDNLLSTFGEETPSLHTNPVFKERKDDVLLTESNNIDLSDFSDQLSLNVRWPLYASHSQADNRYGKYRNNQCTANSCAAIVKSVITPLDNWTKKTMDEVLVNGNQLYIETCHHINELRHIAAGEIVTQSNQFKRHVSLEITWLPHDVAVNLEENIIEYFERSKYSNGILTCQSFSYAIMFEHNVYWFFDPHSNPPYGTAVLHRTDLNGLMNILQSKIRNPMAEFDISYVKATVVQNEDLTFEPKLECGMEGKHPLSDTTRSNEVLKKTKLDVNLSTMFVDEHISCISPKKVDDFEPFIDENEQMLPYSWLYDSRNIEQDDTKCRFHVTPWKDQPETVHTDENYKRRLNLMDYDASASNIVAPNSPAKVLEGPQSPLGYVTTAKCNQKYLDLAQLPGFDIVACVVATLNQSIDAFTGWSVSRLHSILDEAEKILPSFQYPNDNLVLFEQSFHYDMFFYGQGAPSDIEEVLHSFYQSYDYGLLGYNKKVYSLSNFDEYYCFFDPHSCNSNGYPSSFGTSCVMVINNFDTLINIVGDRVTNENTEQFTLYAVQIEQINDWNVVQKDLEYENMPHITSIRSSIKHNFEQETNHLCAAIAVVTTNFINPFQSWNSALIDLILQDANKIFYDLKCDKQLDINNDFKMFLLRGRNVQTSLYEIIFDTICDGFSNVLKTFFNSYESGIIVLNDQFFAIMFKDKKYCLFDSYGIDHEGYSGNACVIIIKTLSQLEDLLLSRAVKCHGNEDLKIAFYRLDVEKVNGIDFDIHHSNEAKTPEVEIDTNFFDLPINCPVSLMRPIDDIIPRPEDFIDVNIDNKDINSENIPLISIKRATKPPLSHKTNRRFEEYCFPVLFPKGINGLNEDREIKMTALDYFQYRIMGKDTRFHSKEYLLFALNFVENEKVTKNISVCGKIQQNLQNISNVASNLHLVMRTIRGTSAYWGNALLDLLAMVKVLGPGTAFLTLSCNDLNWDFMLKACLQAEGKGDVDPTNLSHQERQHLVENNPVMVSRLFNREIQNMVKILKNGQALKDGTKEWKVTDYWYRIEWQQRGSPHCHMIIWIKDFPKLDSPEGIIAMESLCRCDIPDDDEELANHVKRYQRHHCTSTCFKTRSKPSNDTEKNDDKQELKQRTNSNTCRFSFPRKPCKETKVLDPESTEFIKNGHRLVQLKRNENARYINNYNANILRIWQANMDFQFITSQAIVSYVAKYSCKAEPSSLHNLINEAIKEAEKNNEDTKKTLFKVTMKILNERQVSCCEAATRLCHLPMKGSTRKVVFINSSRPEERYRMLNVQSSNPQNNTYFSNIIDRYELRPDDLEEMSLAEFAMEYQPHYKRKNDDVVIDEENGDCEFNEENEDTDLIQKSKKNPGIPLKDGRSFIKKRTRSAVFRSRYFSLIDNRSNHFYGLLLLHLPFRSEKELLEKRRINDNDPIERYAEDATDLAFFEKRHLLRPFNNSCTVEEYLQYSFELQDAIRQMEVLMNGLNSTPEENNNDEQDNTVQDDIRIEDLNDVPQNLPSADLLNSDQRKVFKLVQEWIKAVHRNEKVSQLLLFTSGVGGTGKSFLVAQIIRIVKDYFEPIYPNTRVVFAAAPTGIAALTINGQTLHSALSLGIELGEVSKYRPLTGNYLKQKRELWKNVQLLIIDEISMVSYEMFKNIDLRLKELMSNDSPFGGINVFVFGDLLQLPPVYGHCIYERPNYLSELHLWRLFDFFELEIIMRTKDKEFIELQKAMRIGKLEHKHRQMLFQRVENDTLKREGIFDDLCVTMIAPVNATVEKHNANALQKLVANNYENEKEKYQRDPSYQGYYVIRAIDELQVKTNDKDWEKFIPKDDNKCAGIPKEIKLAVGARVMLRRNIDVSRGLVNGALGNVKSFNWGGCFLKDQSESGDLPESVTITFDKAGDTDIKPTRCEFKANGGRGLVDRLQLPLILAWAVTSHKLQGVTVETAVLDLGPKVFEKGQGYVMVSRVSSLEGILILGNFDLTKLEEKYVNQKAIKEMERLNKLQLANWTAFLQPRELYDSRYKLI